MATLVNEQSIEQSFEPAGVPVVSSVGIQLRLGTLTVGGAIAIAVVVAAALLRLYSLGSRPLSGDEASQALAVLHYVRGQDVDLTQFSPWLTNLNILLFFVASPGDFAARLVPAVFGIALVLLPVLLFRRRMGMAAAIGAAVLTALSPTLMLLSRTVEPASLTAVAGLVFIGSLFDFIDSHAQRPLVVGAAALALALTAGPGVYTILLFMLLAALLGYLSYRRASGTSWRRVAAAYVTLREDRTAVVRAGIVFGLAFVAAATGFLINWSGIQAALNQAGAWLTSFGLVREYPVWYYPATLAIYEPAIVLLGLIGTLAALRRRNSFESFLVLWFGGGFVLYTLVGPTRPAGLLPVLLPLVLLAGRGAQVVVAFGTRQELERSLLVATVVTPLFVYGLLQLAFVARATASMNLYLALGAALVVVVIAVVFGASQWGMGWPRSTVLRGAAIAGLAVTLGLTVHATWRLNYVNDGIQRELILPTLTSRDVRTLVDVTETLSQDRLEDTVSLPITVERTLSPLVPWYLRDFTTVNIVDEILEPPGTPAVVVPGTEQAPPIGDQYVGQRFRLVSAWRPLDFTLQGFLRWYFYRKGQPVVTDDVILFVMR
jgi:uncharacterized protein (TIGR03663 family)